MQASLADRRVLILGASGGMGSAVAKALSKRGMHVGAAGRDLAKLEAVCADCADDGGPLTPILFDLGSVSTIALAAASAVERLGGVDYLINCAGIHITAKSQDADLDAWDRMLDSNFRGFVHATRLLLPEICRSGEGAIISVGSITSAYSGAGMHIAAKRALIGFCEALFEDIRETGTKVCMINPGFVNTPMVRSDRLDRTRMIQPEDIARTVNFVIDMPSTACPTEIVIRPQRSPYLKQ